MSKQQTAVEFLLEELTYDNGFGQRWVSFGEGVDISEYFTKALQMEREQIETAYWEGGQDVPINENRCAEYYEQTYGK